LNCTSWKLLPVPSSGGNSQQIHHHYSQ
jgi:hypothetical protein